MEKNGRRVWYICFFAAFLVIAYLTPYCHDEWKWGLPARMELMREGFPNYNGRYLGNILALLITRSILAKTLVIAVGSTLVLWIMDQCIPGKKNLFYLLTGTVLLLGLPNTLYEQSFGWPAAFVNFVPGVILFLVFYKWTEEVYRSEELVRLSRLQTVLLIPIGIATQLFSEHITIFVVLYAAWLVIYEKVKSKKWNIAFLCYLASTAAGAAVMFSNGAYHRAATKPTAYKHISLSAGVLFDQFCTGIFDHLFLNNCFLNIVLALVLIGLLAVNKKKGFLEAVAVLIFTGYSVYSVWHKLFPEWVFLANETLNSLIEIGIAFLFFLSVLVCIWKTAGKDERMSICVLYISMAVTAGPLLAANPIGARCFFISYIFECVVVLKLVRELADRVEIDFFYPLLISATAAMILLAVYTRTFMVIGASDQLRTLRITEAKENNLQEVILPVLPYKEFIWTTEPANEEWETYFKAFHNIPETMNISFQ